MMKIKNKEKFIIGYGESGALAYVLALMTGYQCHIFNPVESNIQRDVVKDYAPPEVVF